MAKSKNNMPTLAKVDVFRPKDVYTIVNAVLQDVTGQRTITAVDTSSFINVGQMCLSTSKEGTLQALSNMVARTVIDSRAYTGRFTSIEVSRQDWGLFMRKIAFFASEFEQTDFVNTQQNPDTLVDGNSLDMYKIKKRYPLELWYGDQKTLNQTYTRFLDQLNTAFQSESEFSAFMQGMAVEIQNDVARWKEMENRLCVMNYMGAIYNTGKPGSKVNLTEAFNVARNTAYTTHELLTTHLQEFLSFFVSRLETDTALLEESTELFHLTPLCTDDKAWVYPAIFGPGYLSFGNYEGVTFWQNINNRSAINVTPAQFNVTTAEAERGKPVQLDYVVGLLYDKRAMATTYFNVWTTPFNTRGEYWNIEHHWKMNYTLDPTENAILYYMADPVNPGP